MPNISYMSNDDMSLIKKYVNGEDIDDLEKLENDRDFMQKVLNYTKDYKMYYLVGDDLKKDLDFIEFVVEKFKHNVKFITEVADEYINQSDNEINNLELSIIMEKLLPPDSEYLLKYTMFIRAMYNSETMKSAFYLKDHNDEMSKRQIGLGFGFIVGSYEGNHIILDYYADMMINEIIVDYNVDFERNLFLKFKNPEEAKTCGINNFIISTINDYDSYLADYISVHPNVIENLSKRLNNHVDEWDRRSKADERKRYNRMFIMLQDYFENSKTTLDEDNLINYVAEELGIQDKYKEYSEEVLDFAKENTSHDYLQEDDYPNEYDDPFEIESKKLRYKYAVNEAYKKQDPVDYSAYDDYDPETDHDYPYEFDSDEFEEEATAEKKQEDKEEIENAIASNPRTKKIYLDIKKIMTNQLFSKQPVDSVYELIGEDNIVVDDSKGDIINISTRKGHK